MPIKIEHGCQRNPHVDNGYIYTVNSNRAHRDDYESVLETDLTTTVYPFIVDPGEYPEIGDFISDGKLVKRQGYQVNNDWSKWKDKDLYGNP